MEGIIQKQTAMQKAPQQKQMSVTALVNSMLDKDGMRKRFDELLGKRTPQFVSSIVSMVNADKNLQQAFYESPMTVIQASLKAAMFDLPIDQSLGYAYIVPFKNYKKDLGAKKMEATFILGWKGMHQLALRTGAYKTINVVDVREGELKSYNRLTEEVKIDFIEDEDARDALPIIGYVGYYRLVNGAEKTVYMSTKSIAAHEKKFRKGEFQGKGWRDDWDAMARKTVYRILIGKWGVMSIDYQTRGEGEQLADAIAADIQEEGLIDGTVVDESTGEAIETSEVENAE
jgi:recombination protein RecT|nr:MAG TPA: RecT protein [Caudoviricetes sp.]DAT51532.1 MAG TPA: RecT protein [Caudoviricetes sp.]DAZ76799.1 MAG TPA: RecT protein [Caudoviricetes sp.]